MTAVPSLKVPGLESACAALSSTARWQSVHRVIKPAIGSTLVTGAMLVLASMLLHYLSAEQLRAPGATRQYILDPFVWSNREMLLYRAAEFLSFLPVSAGWCVGLVLPALWLSARRRATPARQRALAIASVAVIGGGFVLMHQTAVGNFPAAWRGDIAFGVGAIVGMAGTATAAWLLPSDTPQERARDR